MMYCTCTLIRFMWSCGTGISVQFTLNIALFFFLLSTGTHEWDKFVTPDELRAYVESTSFETAPGARSSTMKLVKQSGIVMQPVSPFKKMCRVVEWGLSDTDLDVNYISHFVKF